MGKSNRSSDPQRSYTYDMITNCGPLAGLPGNPIRNFAGGRYDGTTLESDMILYHAGQAGGLRLNGRTGIWCTRQPIPSEAVARIDYAIPPVWQNHSETGERVPNATGASPIEANYQLLIPKGTSIYEGRAATKSPPYMGGSEQVYVPISPELPPIEVLREDPLRTEPFRRGDPSPPDADPFVEPPQHIKRNSAGRPPSSPER